MGGWTKDELVKYKSLRRSPSTEDERPVGGKKRRRKRPFLVENRRSEADMQRHRSRFHALVFGGRKWRKWAAYADAATAYRAMSLAARKYTFYEFRVRNANEDCE